MFEQKIPTVSMHVNNESFAVVPFDNYEDAIKAAKQALVALNGGDAMQSLIDRLCSVEMALAEEKARNTTVLKIDGDLLRTLSITERQGVELDREPPKVAVIEPEKATNQTPDLWVAKDSTWAVGITEKESEAKEFKANGWSVAAYYKEPVPQKAEPERKAVAWMGESKDGITRGVTMSEDVAKGWKEEKDVKITPLYE